MALALQDVIPAGAEWHVTARYPERSEPCPLCGKNLWVQRVVYERCHLYGISLSQARILAGRQSSSSEMA